MNSSFFIVIRYCTTSLFVFYGSFQNGFTFLSILPSKAETHFKK
ncbi:hypothetical protein HMPREF1881_00066 [Streptococcus agalactiae]|nr:hypothetical protein HMPREF1881_00066 [Streptococcus agalactiae]